MKSRIERGLGGLVLVNKLIACLLFVGLTGVVTLQVISRYVSHQPFLWSEELARFLFFWVVMLGSAMSVKSRRHFVIDVTMGQKRMWGRAGSFFLDVIPDLCVLAFAVFLLYQGIGYTQAGLLRVASNSQINMAFVYVAIPVFAALTIIYAAGNLLVDWVAFRRGEGTDALPHEGGE